MPGLYREWHPTAVVIFSCVSLAVLVLVGVSRAVLLVHPAQGDQGRAVRVHPVLVGWIGCRGRAWPPVLGGRCLAATRRSLLCGGTVCKCRRRFSSPVGAALAR